MYAEKSGDDICLFVSIADVSWFVLPGSLVDKEAYERGTSVYFPDTCIPMLPEVLSNEFCSLKPDEDRLCFTAEMKVNPEGKVFGTRFYKSVINSKRRLTYNAVKRALVDRNPVEIRKLGKTTDLLLLLRQCFKRLNSARKRRGSIDFGLPEPQIIIDLQGGITDIVRAERHEGHMMIEEFMVAANESVARFLTEKKSGCMFRIHDAPPKDKLVALQLLLHNLGHACDLNKSASPKTLGKIIDTVRGLPEERLVNHVLLRSMSRAIYSERNAGHFGLGLKYYCHFTSPIRRYPDLIVHRLLSLALRNSKPSKKNLGDFDLHESGEHCSLRERSAMEAEREIAKLYASLFMQDQIGQEFEGIVSHVTKFGFFVELTEYFVEGLVHIDSLRADRFHFEEAGQMLIGKRGSKIKIGDKLKILVLDVNVPAREIQFTLA